MPFRHCYNMSLRWCQGCQLRHISGPKAVRNACFVAALSDILFNKVKHLGAFCRKLRELLANKLC
jgi:hypothetical protein